MCSLIDLRVGYDVMMCFVAVKDYKRLRVMFNVSFICTSVLFL